MPLTIGANPPSRQPAPTGRLVYIRRDAVYIAPAAGGPERRIPGSEHAEVASISPSGDTLLFFVNLSNKKSEEDHPERGFVSRAPFTRSAPLPAPLDAAHYPEVTWSRARPVAFVRSADKVFTHRPADGSLKPGGNPQESASIDGRLVAWRTGGSTDFGTEIRLSTGSKETILASKRQAASLRNAVRHAKQPERLRTMIRDFRHKVGGEEWYVGVPALSPDGQALYFACNAGTPVGAPGGTDYCFFAKNLLTGNLIALSGLGTIEGCRLPNCCCVSPDGKRLLFDYEAFGNAIESSEYLQVVDLATQRSHELLHRGIHKGDDNDIDGSPCWSPDSHYVAAATEYYQVRTQFGREINTTVRTWKPEGGWGKFLSEEDWDLEKSDNWTVLIFDASNGRRIRIIPHARSVSWSR